LTLSNLRSGFLTLTDPRTAAKKGVMTKGVLSGMLVTAAVTTGVVVVVDDNVDDDDDGGGDDDDDDDDDGDGDAGPLSPMT